MSETALVIHAHEHGGFTVSELALYADRFSILAAFTTKAEALAFVDKQLEQRHDARRIAQMESGSLASTIEKVERDIRRAGEV